jgi:hypothetical protein
MPAWATFTLLGYSFASDLAARAQPGNGGNRPYSQTTETLSLTEVILDLCYVTGHRSAVAGDSLYFMSGLYTIEGQVSKSHRMPPDFLPFNGASL